MEVTGQVWLLKDVSFCVWFWILSESYLCTADSAGEFKFQNIDRRVFSKPGDINIGAVVMATQAASAGVCSPNIRKGSKALEYTESVAFAVQAVNDRPDLLPNITLGYHILNDCTLAAVALAQSLSFIPRSDESCVWRSQAPTVCADDILAAYDVIGVLAPLRSSTAAPVSLVYTPARIPLIGAVTSSDEFSDKKIHPYFFRVIGPDKFQVKAILHFITRHGWSYVSVVYIEGAYGERAMDTIATLAPDFRICLASWTRVKASEDTDDTARTLLNFRSARVVIVFLEADNFVRLVTSVDRLNATGHFIWVASDAVDNAAMEVLLPVKDGIMGAFFFSFYAPLVPDFYTYIQRQSISNSTNPWFKPNWESLNGCSFKSGTCDEVIDDVSMSRLDFKTYSTFQMDAVLALAHGAHKLISGVCPGFSGSRVRACVKPELLHHYLQNLSFTGYSGRVQFDENGDSVGRYVVHQVTDGGDATPLGYGGPGFVSPGGFRKLEVAFYDEADQTLTYTSHAISWSHLKEFDAGKTYVTDLGNSSTPRASDAGRSMTPPESVCSRPCVSGEYRIQKKPLCCWECRACRNNEKTTPGGCEECPALSWPDADSNLTTCSPIPLTRPEITSVLSLLQIILALLLAILSCGVLGAFIHLRHHPIIAAASRDLSLIQFPALLVACVTVVCLQTYPTHQMCSVLYFTFCLSLTSLYSPVLVKVVRIYRVMNNASLTRLVGQASLTLLSVGLILIQLLLCIYVTLTYRPTAKATQPVLTEKFVELACDLTFPGLVTFLTYNLVLVSLCSVFAFKSRKLPDNFNESRFISMCVSTTLVIWLAFIPTYFTAGREYVRVLLLSVSLILNHTVALVFLFLPKVYAAVYLLEQV
ncbi:metabotropic glutamate receptor 4-like [Physella acuta]|uniref:metabotropic glutamate receptor 4-like n=1 Tax=Physella acuta TaxID=109671 RepID=UPI0027DBBAF9|nr:metabotropic glutamate receptor 4-like [Physella acuta]